MKLSSKIYAVGLVLSSLGGGAVGYLGGFLGILALLTAITGTAFMWGSYDIRKIERLEEDQQY